MEQPGGLDAAFLYCETPTTHLHVCGLLLLDPSTMAAGYSYDRLRAVLIERLPRIPAVRQKLVTLPLNLARPFWAEDCNLDLDRHLHRLGSQGDAPARHHRRRDPDIEGMGPRGPGLQRQSAGAFDVPGIAQEFGYPGDEDAPTGVVYAVDVVHLHTHHVSLNSGVELRAPVRGEHHIPVEDDQVHREGDRDAVQAQHDPPDAGSVQEVHALTPVELDHGQGRCVA